MRDEYIVAGGVALIGLTLASMAAFFSLAAWLLFGMGAP